jgi:hypothetical protein
MVKTKSQTLLDATGAFYTALNLTTPPTVEGIERAMSMAKYIFTKPVQKISDENVAAKLGELSTEAQSHLVLTTAENIQRMKEGKQPY